jgi:hypothetical protein
VPIQRVAIDDDVIRRRVFYTDLEKSGALWSLCCNILEAQDAPIFFVHTHIYAKASDYIFHRQPAFSYLFEEAFSPVPRGECDQADAFIVGDLNSPENKARENDGKLIWTLEQFLLMWRELPEGFALEAEEETPEESSSPVSDETQTEEGQLGGVNPLSALLSSLLLLPLFLKLRGYVENFFATQLEQAQDTESNREYTISGQPYNEAFIASIDKLLTSPETHELASPYLLLDSLVGNTYTQESSQSSNLENISTVTPEDTETDPVPNSDDEVGDPPPPNGRSREHDSESINETLEDQSPTDMRDQGSPLELVDDNRNEVDQPSEINVSIEFVGVTDPPSIGDGRSVTIDMARADTVATPILVEEPISEASGSEVVEITTVFESPNLSGDQKSEADFARSPSTEGADSSEDADRANDSKDLDNLGNHGEPRANQTTDQGSPSGNPGDSESAVDLEDSSQSGGADSLDPPDDSSPFLDSPPKLPDDEKNGEAPEDLDFSYLDFSGGQKTINISQETSHIIISNFGGVGRGTNPSQDTLDELDTLIFEGSLFSVENIIFESNGRDVEITFDGLTSFSITLRDFDLELFDNIPFSYNGFDYVGNAIFDNQSTILDSFDVVDENSNRETLFNINKLTVFNDFNNRIYGRDRSNDIIHAQGGDDYVLGFSGDDILRGGKGDDLLDGGKGLDTLYGGSGADGFILRPNEGLDVIKDFSIADGDYILLPDTSALEDITVYSLGSIDSHGQDGYRTIIAIQKTGQIIGEIHGEDLSTEDWNSFIKLGTPEDFLGI